MQHIGTSAIETDRLILRRFTLDDAEAMYENWCKDPEVTHFLTWPPHDSTDATRKVLLEWIKNYIKNDYYLWAVVLKENGPSPVGSISVVEQDDGLGIAHIGYCLGRAWWRRGIATEALRAVIGHLFNQVGYTRIESRHDPRNPHSGMVMQKCGMRYERTLRQSDHNNQGICDAAYYAILASDARP